MTEPFQRRFETYFATKKLFDERHKEIAKTFQSVASHLQIRLNERFPHKYGGGEVGGVAINGPTHVFVQMFFRAWEEEEQWQIPVRWAIYWEDQRMEALDQEIAELVVMVQTGKPPIWLPQ